MKVDSRSQIDRIGVSATQLKFARLGWLFREQSVSDYGIDAHVEIVVDERSTGQLIALQIKSGESWFREKADGGVVFRGDIKHLAYWKDHSLPVIVVLYDPDTENCYWQTVNNDTVTKTEKGWKLIIPFTQKVDEQAKDTLNSITGKIIVETKYTILSLRDVSTALAKRYSSNILLNGEFTREEIVQIVHTITEDLKTRQYHRNEFTKARWSGKKAHVVWLFVYPSLEDVRNINWICRSQWISSSLASTSAPHRLVGIDTGKSIVVDWNNMYVVLSRFRDEHTLTKELYLEQTIPILDHTKKLVRQAAELTNHYANGEITNQAYIDRMKNIEEPLTKLYFQAGNVGLAPMECNDLGEKFQQVMALAHNVVLPFSDRGLQTWPERNRNFIVRDAIKNYLRELVRLGYELEKVL